MSDKKLVIDASVVAKIFFKEEVGENADGLLDLHLDLHAPLLLVYEFSSVLTSWVRRKLATADEAKQIRLGFRQLDLEFHHSNTLLDEAFEVALNTGLAIYDATYIALADQLNVPLLTADQRLTNALAQSRYAVATRSIADLVAD